MQMPSGRQLRAGRILAGLDQSELARLAKVHVTTIVRLEAFEANQVRGQSGTITAVVNALAKAGVDLGENGSIIPRPKCKGR
jgi:predicted transcriptional regulator